MTKIATGLFVWFEDLSDWLSPMVVKEVRQMVRTWEFLLSFSGSLGAGLLVAGMGGAAVLRGERAVGADVFGALVFCLMVIGLAVAPIGGFSALRSERIERTLELVQLTTLTARRIVIGKVLAQGVKLLTIFAGMAPFVAMSFLLGGVDIVTILAAILTLFLCSLWACAAGMFLSTVAKSRGMSVVLIVGLGFSYIYAFSVLNYYYQAWREGYGWFVAGSGLQVAWVLGLLSVFCALSMINLVLLAENCLALEDEDRSNGLRVGLFAQFLFLAIWPLFLVFLPAGTRPGASLYTTADAFYLVALTCGVQLMIEAFILVTGDMAITRRTWLRDKPTRYLPSLTVIFRPGGTHALAYLLAKIALLLLAGWALAPDDNHFNALLAFCGYVCFFTGFPTYIFRLIAPQRVTPVRLRVAMLFVFAIAMVVPEIVIFATSDSVENPLHPYRHIFNPAAVLMDWNYMEDFLHWLVILLGGFGLLTYFRLMTMARLLNNAARDALRLSHSGLKG